MSRRQYSLRSSPGQRRVAATTATSATSTSYSATTSVSSTSNHTDDRTLTPAPVQRTLHMEEADDYDEEDDDDEEVVRQFVRGGDDDDVEEVEELDAFGRARLVREDDDDENDEAETDEDDDEATTPTRRSFTRARAASTPRRESTFGAWRRRAANSAFVAKLNRSRPIRQAMSAVRELWQFVVRNSFMTFNFVWLLLPLGCFMIAILVPHYLTTAIRYVDILTTSSNGFQANLAYEKGMMRSIVQEIVDVKLSTMLEEITSLRNTIVAQEREFEGLRLLHESFRQAHEDTQKKLSVVDSNSILSIHIEHVVSKHAETLWKRFQDKTTKLEEVVRTSSNQQHELMETVAHHQDDILELRTVGVASSSSAKAPSMSLANERAFKEELFKWKAALQEELHMTLEREVVDVEDRMHKSLLTEKQILEDSVKTLHTLDAANPALVSMIESAVVKVDKQKAGAPDFAALANGGIVVRHESDLLESKSRSPVEILETLFGFSAGDSPFTSSSFRSFPVLRLSSVLAPHDVPWWLSRHNARPETALSETKEIGSCWGLAGPTGRLTVKFARRIFAESITIDHIPEEIATDFSSAPKSVRVFGVAADRSREVVEFLPFGNFTYERDGAASQTFRLTSSLRQRIAIDGAKLEITSNHGHPDYTCLYRFQVHGTPAP